MEVTPMISIDPHSVYHFRYPLFRSLPDLTINVNSIDDLKKIGIFYYIDCRCYINYTHITYLDTNEPDLRQAESVEEAALSHRKHNSLSVQHFGRKASGLSLSPGITYEL